VLSVYGGKITTFRKLAEQAVDMLLPELGVTAPAWTAPAHLPGGDIANANFEHFLGLSKQRFSWLDEVILQDWARNYGTRIDHLIGDGTDMESLGHHFGGAWLAKNYDFSRDFSPDFSGDVSQTSTPSE